MNELLSISYWLNSRPEALGPLGKRVLAIISLLSAIIFIIIIIKAYSDKLTIYKASIDKLAPFFITNVIISIYIAFVNYELVPVLRSRIWYIIWGIIMIIWIISIIRDFYKKARKREELLKQAEKNKYIP